MQTAPTKTATAEHVTGPGNGLIPLVAVIVLTIATWGGLWMLHKAWYSDPLNPVSAVEAPAGAHGASH